MTRREKCQNYLRRAGSLPAARKLAAVDGFRANASVWVGALGKMLSVRRPPRLEVQQYSLAERKKWKCRGCGCTQAHACLGGCSWVRPRWCSSCEVYGPGALASLAALQLALKQGGLSRGK